MNKYEILKRYYGHDSFRPGQEEIIDCLCRGRDVLCVMPTGAGKSVCYQLPALMMQGTSLVISPLISLMKDQVGALTELGISAAYINSSLTTEEYRRTVDAWKAGSYRILYVAPERLDAPEFLAQACRLPISLIAVDEAHCISRWGHDFRPSYFHIAQFIERLPHRPVIGAFTATATEAVKADIARLLQLRDPFCITTGFDRPNLYFGVKTPQDKRLELLSLLRQRRGQSGIVYCSTRRAVEEVCEYLCTYRVPATRYHAGLSDEERHRNQEDFLYDRRTVMVATNAFGMGIDKSNVSFVIHYNMPLDMESYYQEAGRAGRDGSPADCILLYSPRDIHSSRFLIESQEPGPDLSREEWEELRSRDRVRLSRMIRYCSMTDCLRNYILDYFGEKTGEPCGNCSNCRAQYEDRDVTTEAQMILSCIAHTGQRYGSKMIAAVLRGSRMQRIAELLLNRQSTYGLMENYSEEEICRIIDLLALRGLLRVSEGKYPVLQLTENSGEVLFRGARVQMRCNKSPDRTTVSAYGSSIADPALFAILREKRRHFADLAGVPAYMIFSDRTLIEMCNRRPHSVAQLMEIPGVGLKKLKQYGKEFLVAILLYERDRLADTGADS